MTEDQWVIMTFGLAIIFFVVILVWVFLPYGND